MSKLIAQAAIRGAYKLVSRAKKEFEFAREAFGEEKKVEFPNTAYYLPIIYGITGIAVKKIADIKKVLSIAEDLLPPHVDQGLHLPYLGWVLDAGMATLFAEEIIEALKYLKEPIPYHISSAPSEDRLWIGAADDKILRERGIEFVDGTAPGFAACVGGLPDTERAVQIARELQEKNLYTFMCAYNRDNKSMAWQLKEKNIQLGWETRLVPFGEEITAAVFALGFATRAAMSFGNVQPGDYKRILLYNKYRIFAFVLTFGEVEDEWYATGAGAINYGFPIIADTNIPQILPRGICMYEHVVSNVSHDKIVDKAIEIRGLKVVTVKIDIPLAYGPAFEGERIRKDDVCVEVYTPRTKLPSFEFLRSLDVEEVEDGKIEIIGDDLDKFKDVGSMPLGILVEVGGARMQKDFEPVLERQIHKFINFASGIWHAGQRNANWIRISKAAYNAGFRLVHLGRILYAKYKGEYSAIVDKVQIKLITDRKIIEEWIGIAKKEYTERDKRLEGLTDEAVDTFYTCTLCQSFAPDHVCIIMPQRPGLCGALSWLDGKASYEINPHGPNQPVEKGICIDPQKGQWEGVNKAVEEYSHGKLKIFNFYTMMDNPMTSCGCFECISCVLPMTNGIMVVDRNSMMMTPCGMTFSTLAGSVGGGLQTPGFIGHSKLYLLSEKFIKADGGIKRIVWMPKALKEELKLGINKRAKEEGIDNFVDLIADETIAQTEEEVLAFINQVNHPVLNMPSMV